MGQLKEEALNLLLSFISTNQKVENKVFFSRLQELVKDLTILQNQNSDHIISEGTIIVNTDGSSRGNPGKAGIGIQIKDHLNNIILRDSRKIGIKTNNQAEYTAVIEALKICREKGYKKVLLYSDSELIIKQINNEYRIKNPELKILNREVKELEKGFESIKFIHVKREKNKEADRLSR